MRVCGCAERCVEWVLQEASTSSAPTSLATDNTAARDLSYNPELHDRSKHIARRHLFVRDMVESLEIVVPFVSTVDNLADFFTKPIFPASRFYALRGAIMNEPEPHVPPSRG